MRSANMQALTNDLKRRWPGMTIYGVGDDDHRLRVSDHNEDDTPGSKSAQTDADTVPEHRAIDAMHSAGFTLSEARALVAKMVDDAASKRRLYYIIHGKTIWSRSNNWVGVPYDGEAHDTHVHFSGWADDDENASSWPVVFAPSGSGPTPPRLHRQWPTYMRTGHYFGSIQGPPRSHGGYYERDQPDIAAIQSRLKTMGFYKDKVDGIFGPKTISAVAAWQHRFWPATNRYGEVWKDGWVNLFTY